MKTFLLILLAALFGVALVVFVAVVFVAYSVTGEPEDPWGGTP